MTSPLEQHTMAAAYALHLLEVVERWQIAPDDLLDVSGIHREALTDPAARLPMTAVERLVERALQLTGEPALGLFMGYEMRPSWHGFLGFAVMSAATLREAIELLSRYAPTRSTAFGLNLHIEGTQASLVLEEKVHLGAAREALVTATLIGLWQTGNAVTGSELPGSAEFAFAEPEYCHRFAPLIPAKLRFSQPRHRLLFDAALLDLRLPMADRVALRLAREQCQRELEAIGHDGRLVSMVRSLIAPRRGGFRSLEEVACLLHVSVRTLKRRLAARGTSYSALLDEARRDRALILLGSGMLSVEQVADQLGYSNAANFARAFRRLTGTTPRAYRAWPSPGF